MPLCTTCNRPVNAPRTVVLGGRIVEACCDYSHADHLIPATGYAAWFRGFWGRKAPKPVWQQLDQAR
ncbi:hypothetical protein LCGC14_3143120 [marine sediment metagenome]|uniref:Uncharacterized protein n=1 Tax=marine sediment metagenome TaxID=412755 RepID=A0A0F8YKL3_9ZZZZ